MTPRPFDNRSRRVVFVSHCLLNENVRYPGGAACAGVAGDVAARYAAAGVGICQMPCPEQHAWGGVLKPGMTRWYGSRVARWAPTRRALTALASTWTRVRYRWLARRVVDDIVDFLDSGCEVVELVGVGASPSCGVHTTLDLGRALAAMGRCDVSRLDAVTVNGTVVAANVTAGAGMFITALRSRLRRRGVEVSLREHDLLGELRDAGLLGVPGGPADTLPR